MQKTKWKSRFLYFNRFFAAGSAGRSSHGRWISRGTSARLHLTSTYSNPSTSCVRPPAAAPRARSVYTFMYSLDTRLRVPVAPPPPPRQRHTPTPPARARSSASPNPILRRGAHCMAHWFIHGGVRKPGPAYGAVSAPSSSSMRSSWLYLERRSERHGAPVLICPVQRPTARSAM